MERLDGTAFRGKVFWSSSNVGNAFQQASLLLVYVLPRHNHPDVGQRGSPLTHPSPDNYCTNIPRGQEQKRVAYTWERKGHIYWCVHPPALCCRLRRLLRLALGRPQDSATLFDHVSLNSVEFGHVTLARQSLLLPLCGKCLFPSNSGSLPEQGSKKKGGRLRLTVVYTIQNLKLDSLAAYTTVCQSKQMYVRHTILSLGDRHFGEKQLATSMGQRRRD